VTTQNTTTTVEIRADAFWPDEANLAAFVAQADRTEQDDQAVQTDRTLEYDAEYAALYFVS
jgi:hypothetical protein